jgi:hypothetical protein
MAPSKYRAALLTALLAGAVPATDPAAEPDTVVIEAGRARQQVEEQVHEYVAQALVPGDDESVARWLVPACPLVAGLTPARNKFITDRIVQVAVAAGVPVAPESCSPNLLVIATADPESLLREWRRRDRHVFVGDRGIGGVEHFIATPRPVRTWHNAMSGCPGGAGTFRARGGTFYSECIGNGRMGSHLEWETVRTVYSALLVIDLSRVGELSMGQISDYIAISAFTPLRDRAGNVGAPSVLQLFAHDVVAKPDGLTRWDRAFLKALYATRATHTTQVSELRERMAGLLAH